jgi:VanZ family protein
MNVRRLLPPLFWAGLLFGFVVAILPKPIALPGNPGDKVQHILAFLVLTALACLAYPRAGLIKILIGMSAYGALIEFAQMIPVLNRHAELLDWLADTAAAGFVLLLVALLRRRPGRTPARTGR